MRCTSGNSYEFLVRIVYWHIKVNSEILKSIGSQYVSLNHWLAERFKSILIKWNWFVSISISRIIVRDVYSQNID